MTEVRRGLLALALLVVVGLLAWLAARSVWTSGPGPSPGSPGSQDPAPVAPAGASSERTGASDRHSGAGGDEPDHAAGHGAVHGVVLQADGGPPAAGLGVVLARGATDVRTVTGPDGTFEFRQVPATTGWTVTVEAPRGFGAIRVEGLRVRDRRTLDVGVLVLTMRSGIVGVVVDAYGRPVAGASVAAFDAPETLAGLDAVRAFDRMHRSPEAAAASCTDAEGRFRLAGLPAGRWTIVARRPPDGIGGASAALADDGVSPPVRITLPAGHRLEGRIVGPPALDPAELTVVVAPKFEIVAGGEAPASQVRAGVAPDGSFALEGLEARDWTLAVDGGAWISIRDDDVAVPARQPVEIELPSAASLVGTVTGPDGSPVADAAVCHVDGGWYTMARSSADGTWRIPAVREGRPDFFCVRAKGFAPWPGTLEDALRPGRQRIDLAQGENRIDTRLGAAGRAEGTVVERASGRPIAGAEVRAVSPMLFFGGTSAATTDTEGRFTLADLPCERTVFLASRDGWAQPGLGDAWRAFDGNRPVADAIVATPSPDESVDVRIELVPATVLRGRVLGPSGEPVARAVVRAVPPSGRIDIDELPPLSPAPCVTGPDGGFALSLPMDLETLTLEVRAAGLPPTRRVVTPVDGNVELEIRLESAGAIEGCVLGASGAPVAGAEVRCIAGDALAASDVPPSGLRTETDPDGRFAFRDLPATKWEVRVREPRHVGRTHTIEVAAGGTARDDFTLASAWVVSGSVLRPDGTPAAGAYVELRQAGEGGKLRTSFADPAGAFEFSSVPVGPWIAEASLDGLAPSVPVRVEGETAGLVLRLAAHRAISGTARWRDGGPAAGLNVTLTRGDGDRARSSAPVAPDGTFSVPELAAARWYLGVEGPEGGGWGQRTVEGGGWTPAGTEGVVLIVAPGFTLAGEVVLDDGTPARGAAVSFARLGEDPQVLPSEAGRVTTMGQTSATEGRFRIEHLAAGAYGFTIRTADGATTTATARTADTQVRIRFCPRGRVRGRVVRADGTGVAGAHVAATSREGSAPRTRTTTTTDASGAFEFGALLCGRTEFSVEWMPDDGRVKSVVHDVVHGDNLVEVVLAPSSGR